MVAGDVLCGDMLLSLWNSRDSEFLLDELPRDRKILVISCSGQRAYYATRILLQNGFNARNLAGGMLSRTILGEPVA
jgi:rhodanese-related sulfurtransferase